MVLATSEATGTSTDPYLSITYSVPERRNIQDLTYEYDSAGNITSIIDNSSSDAAGTYTYTYDSLNRLTEAVLSGAATSTDYDKVWSYDSLGNISSSTDMGPYTYAGNTGTNYANPDAPTSINGSSYAHNNDGNLTSGGGLSYVWDWRDRLGTTTHSTLTETYGYDEANNRVFYATGTSTTYYPNQYSSIAGATTTKYVLANGEPVARIVGSNASSTLFYVHDDHLGGVNVLSDTSATVAETLSYYPYGSVRVDEQVTANDPRKYIGQMYDTATQLSYLNARYYNPQQGQFLSQDPVFTGNPMGQDLMDPQSLNSYSYAGDNPISQSDPSGRCPWCVTAAVGAVIGGGIGAGTVAFGDLLSGHGSSWQTYAGATAGGAVLGAFWGSGAGLVTLAAAGATSGLIQGDVREGLNLASGQNFNGGSIVQDTILGGALNVGGSLALRYVGLPAFEGLNAGRGSYDSIFKQIFTNLDNGAISNVSPSTYAKMGVSYGYSGLYSTGAQSIIQARQQATQSYNATLGSSGGISGGGASIPSANSLWTTPSGAVVTFGGSLVAGPVSNSTPSH